MPACKFTHDSSIETIEGGFVIRWSSGSVERYRPDYVDDIGAESEVTNLDEGLVHLFGRDAVYEVRADSGVGFVVSKLAIR